MLNCIIFTSALLVQCLFVALGRRTGSLTRHAHEVRKNTLDADAVVRCGDGLNLPQLASLFLRWNPYHKFRKTAHENDIKNSRGTRRVQAALIRDAVNVTDKMNKYFFRTAYSHMSTSSFSSTEDEVALNFSVFGGTSGAFQEYRNRMGMRKPESNPLRDLAFQENISTTKNNDEYIERHLGQSFGNDSSVDNPLSTVGSIETSPNATEQIHKHPQEANRKRASNGTISDIARNAATDAHSSEVGMTYRDRKIVSILPGALLVQVSPGNVGLVPLKEIGQEFLGSIEEAGFVKGDLIDVKVTSKDSRGRLVLSRKELLEAGPPPEVGMTYHDCKVVSVMPNGLLVEVSPGNIGMVPFEEITLKLLGSIEESGLVKGDLIDVKVTGRDSKGRLVLSRKVLLKAESPLEVGMTYHDCKVVSVIPNGLLVEVSPENVGLVPFVEIQHSFLGSTEEAGVVKGDLIDVKVISKGSKGRPTLSRKALLAEGSPPEVGMTYHDCKVVFVRDSGLMVEVTPGHFEFLHIGKIAHENLGSIEEAGFMKGDLIDVKVTGRDSKGQLELSRKVLLEAGSPPEIGITYREGTGRNSDSRLALNRKVLLSAETPPEVGMTYHDRKILFVLSRGLLVEVSPGHVGLVPREEITLKFLGSIEESGFVKGDLIDVKVTGRDTKNRLVLSRKKLLAAGPPPEVGMIYRDCKVVAVNGSGLLVEVIPGHVELVRMREITKEYLGSIEKAGFVQGDLIDVKVTGRDSKGRLMLSRKVLLEAGPLEVGVTYHDCKVVSVCDYGLLVEVFPGHIELLAIKEIAPLFSGSIEEAGFVKGDLIDVKVIGRDSKGGLVLSRKVLLSAAPSPEVGVTYEDCKIVSVIPNGLLVEVTPGYTALLRIEDIGRSFLGSIEEAGFAKDDRIDVKVTGRDSKGRLEISRKVLLAAGHPPEIGMTYRDCKVVSAIPNGLLVEVTPGHIILLFIGNIVHSFLRSIEEAGFVKGDLIDVKVIGRDSEGRLELSRKVLLAADPSPEVGVTYKDCKIVSVIPNGLLVEVTPGHIALLRIEDIGFAFLESIEDAGFAKGDRIDVKVTGRDRDGRLEISRKVLLAGVGNPPEVGMTYCDCRVEALRPTGIIVEVTPGYRSMLRLDQIMCGFPESIEEAGFAEGDLIDVKITGRDSKGRFHLSRKVLLEPATADPPDVGKMYRNCKVVSLQPFGMFVQTSSSERMEVLRISQMSFGRLESMEDSAFKEGDTIDVRVEGYGFKGNLFVSRLGRVNARCSCSSTAELAN